MTALFSASLLKLVRSPSVHLIFLFPSVQSFSTKEWMHLILARAVQTNSGSNVTKSGCKSLNLEYKDEFLCEERDNRNIFLKTHPSHLTSVGGFRSSDSRLVSYLYTNTSGPNETLLCWYDSDLNFSLRCEQLVGFDLFRSNWGHFPMRSYTRCTPTNLFFCLNFSPQHTQVNVSYQMKKKNKWRHLWLWYSEICASTKTIF